MRCATILAALDCAKDGSGPLVEAYPDAALRCWLPALFSDTRQSYKTNNDVAARQRREALLAAMLAELGDAFKVTDDQRIEVPIPMIASTPSFVHWWRARVHGGFRCRSSTLRTNLVTSRTTFGIVSSTTRWHASTMHLRAMSLPRHFDGQRPTTAFLRSQPGLSPRTSITTPVSTTTRPAMQFARR